MPRSGSAVKMENVGLLKESPHGILIRGVVITQRWLSMRSLAWRQSQRLCGVDHTGYKSVLFIIAPKDDLAPVDASSSADTKLNW